MKHVLQILYNSYHLHIFINHLLVLPDTSLMYSILLNIKETYKLVYGAKNLCSKHEIMLLAAQKKNQREDFSVY